MPLYEYRCTHCNEETELLQKMSDAPATTCPHCHKDNLVKQISSTSFQLKGSGWYVTDFKNKPDSKKPAETAVKTEATVTDIKPAEAPTTPKKDTEK